MSKKNQAVEKIFVAAANNANNLGHEYVCLEHIMLCLLEYKDIINLATDLEVDIDQIKSDITNYLNDTGLNGLATPNGQKGPPKKTHTVDRVLQRSLAQVLFNSRNEVIPLDLLLSILAEESCHAKYFCEINGLSRVRILEHIDTINQGTATTPIGKNLAEVSVTGNNNIVSLTQQYNGKYAEIVTNGLSNQITAQQKDANGKSLFINALGNSNNISTLQQGTGNHFLDISAPFGGATASVTQLGASAKQFQLLLNSPGIGVTVTQNNLTVADSAKMEITCTTGPCNGYSYTKN